MGRGCPSYLLNPMRPPQPTPGGHQAHSTPAAVPTPPAPAPPAEPLFVLSSDGNLDLNLGGGLTLDPGDGSLGLNVGGFGLDF